MKTSIKIKSYFTSVIRFQKIQNSTTMQMNLVVGKIKNKTSCLQKDFWD